MSKFTIGFVVSSTISSVKRKHKDNKVEAVFALIKLDSWVCCLRGK
jgi:hypothetical protein